MKVRPLGDRIIVRRHASQDKSAGGVILPDNAKNKPQRGNVLAVGPGKMLKDGTRRAAAGEGRRHGPVHLLGRRRIQGPRAPPDDILLMHEEDVLAVFD